MDESDEWYQWDQWDELGEFAGLADQATEGSYCLQLKMGLLTDPLTRLTCRDASGSNNAEAASLVHIMNIQTATA